MLKREPAAKLLLCAPQNYSADLLASALSGKVPVGDMIRLNDPRRPPNQARHSTCCFALTALFVCLDIMCDRHFVHAWNASGMALRPSTGHAIDKMSVS